MVRRQVQHLVQIKVTAYPTPKSPPRKQGGDFNVVFLKEFLNKKYNQYVTD